MVRDQYRIVPYSCTVLDKFINATVHYRTGIVVFHKIVLESTSTVLVNLFEGKKTLIILYGTVRTVLYNTNGTGATVQLYRSAKCNGSQSEKVVQTPQKYSMINWLRNRKT